MLYNTYNTHDGWIVGNAPHQMDRKKIMACRIHTQHKTFDSWTNSIRMSPFRQLNYCIIWQKISERTTVKTYLFRCNISEHLTKDWIDGFIWTCTSSSRGFHSFFRKYWQPTPNQLLECLHEKDNLYDFFAIKVNDIDKGRTVGHFRWKILGLLNS